MFGKKESELDKLIEEKKSLEKDVKRLKEEVEDLKLKKKISDEDIKHMVKLKMEAVDMDYKKRELVLEKKTVDEIAKVKDSYRDKHEAQLSKETDNIRQMYAQILERLPNVNVRMKG